MKIVLACVACIVLIAVVDARCADQCKGAVVSPMVCARDRANMCHKMRDCQMRGQNCRLRLEGKPMLVQMSMSSCRNIVGRQGSAKCASDCSKIRCTPSRKAACYGSKDNRCRLMSSCQARRENCRRSAADQMRAVSRKRCMHMKSGGPAKPCK